MKRTRRHVVTAVAGAALACGIAGAVAADDLPYNLTAGKPFEGTKLNILSVVTPQFDGLMLRDDEFTELTGIETEWTFIPFTSLQEKVASVGVAADGGFDVVNYLDSWGPPNSHWLVNRSTTGWNEDGISAWTAIPAAFAKSAQFEGKTHRLSPCGPTPMLMFYRRDVLAEVGMAAPPRTWDDVVAIAGCAIRANRASTSSRSRSTSTTTETARISSSGLISCGPRGPTCSTRTPASRCGPRRSRSSQATEDYIALHTARNATNPSSLSFVEQDARQSFHAGQVGDDPGLVVGVFTDDQPGKLDAHKGASGVHRPPDLSRQVGDLRDLHAVLGFLLLQEPGRSLGVPEVALQSEMEKANATEREVAGKPIVNNVVTHVANLQDPDVNAANDNIQEAAWASLEQSDIMPQIAEWPEIGDILSAAITEAAAGGDVEQLMTDAAERAEKILSRAGYY